MGLFLWLFTVCTTTSTLIVWGIEILSILTSPAVLCCWCGQQKDMSEYGRNSSFLREIRQNEQ